MAQASKVLALCMALLLALPAAGQRTTPDSQPQIQLSFAPLVKQAQPAVVNIYAINNATSRPIGWLYNDPLWQQFFGNRLPQFSQRQRNALGSGVIIDPAGLVITNHHVIQNAEVIKVVLANQREFSASIVLTDRHSDIAVLKMDSSGQTFTALPLADSDLLEVGDLVLALGNPFGIGQSVTSGIVSAVERTNIGRNYNYYIQTDAPINPGNSGGALINMNGEVVGLNTAIFSKTGASIGIGFAVPSNLLKAIVHDARHGDKVRRAWLGVEAETLDWQMTKALSLTQIHGVIIKKLHPLGPLKAADIRVNDLIVEVDGKTIRSQEDLRYRISTLGVDRKIAFGFIRESNFFERTIDLKLAPEIPPKQSTLIENSNSRFRGIEITNLSPAVIQDLGFLGSVPETGVVVTRILPNSPAVYFRLKTGDVIVSANGRDDLTVDMFLDLVSSEPDHWKLALWRNGKVFRIEAR